MLGLSTLVLNLKKRHRVVGHEKDAVAGLMLVVSPALAYDDGIFNALPIRMRTMVLHSNSGSQRLTLLEVGFGLRLSFNQRWRTRPHG